jgi:hypothetical protein
MNVLSENLRVSGLRRFVLVVATAATGAGVAGLHAQTALVDPKDSRQIFATTCSACHKSPQGLAKSGQVAGFLRQHYTTGPEMSAAMAAYLVAAGSGPASKKGEKGEKSAENAKTKGKKQEQVAAVPPGTDPAADAKERTLRGKQRPGKQHEAKQHEAKQHESRQDDPPARPSPLPAVTPVAPDSIRQAAAPATTGTTGSGDAPAQSAASAPPQDLTQQPATQPGLDVPMPPLPDPVPSDLTQSVFSSSPVP